MIIYLHPKFDTFSNTDSKRPINDIEPDHVIPGLVVILVVILPIRSAYSSHTAGVVKAPIGVRALRD